MPGIIVGMSYLDGPVRNVEETDEALRAKAERRVQPIVGRALAGISGLSQRIVAVSPKAPPGAICAIDS